MASIISFNVTYDKESDVLYINTCRGPAARGIEDEHGFVWRYDEDGELIGVTVVGFTEFWTAHMRILVEEVSRQFHIPVPQAQIVLDRAIQ